jgi:hypothetical protein
MGEFDDDLTELLMMIQETSTDEKKNVKKRISFLIAECFQNIIRHADDVIDDGLENSPKMFMLRNTHGLQYISTSNPIEKINIKALMDSLEKLQQLSQEELKEIYLSALTNNTMSDKGGGGLGLIEMARKTKNPPAYVFESINEDYSNFFMQLKMKGSEENNSEIDISETISLYDTMVDEHVVLLRKGDFSQDSIVPLFKLFESNLQLKNEDLVFKKKSLYMLIELLQNMNAHAALIDKSKEGMFIVSIKNGNYTMRTGNFIENSKAEKLNEHLDSLQGLDKIELAKRYKMQLMDNTINDDSGAGIGIIEMFRQSSGDISYEFNKINEELSFFSLSASL